MAFFFFTDGEIRIFSVSATGGHHLDPAAFFQPQPQGKTCMAGVP